MRRSARTRDETRPSSTRRRRGLRVRSFLLLVALIPALGSAAIVATSASDLTERREAARALEDEVDALSGILESRVAVAREDIYASVASVATELGIGLPELDTVVGSDFVAELASARTAVDADGTLHDLPGLEGMLDDLRAVRREADTGSTTTDAQLDIFGRLVTALEDLSLTHLRKVDVALESGEFPARVHRRVDAMRSAFEMMSAVYQRTNLLVRLITAPNPAGVQRMYEAAGEQRAAAGRLEDRLGPRGADALLRSETSPATQRTEGLIEEALAILGQGEQLPIDVDSYGDALADAVTWQTGFSDVVHAAALDLQEEAVRQRGTAGDTMRDLLVATAILTIVSFSAALLLSRRVTGPVRELEAAAHAIEAGTFDLAPIEARGPREVADTAAAFNEMTSTLTMVESQAIALVEDPDAAVLDHALPGRTGRSLHLAMNRLRASIRTAEQNRRELELVATHDGLTGLLNRTAALAMIDRELSHSRRTGGVVTALFIDLDGLKTLNDHYGHATGDDAIRLTAEALQESTRRSDVVARLGGDEFLVVGAPDDVAGATLVADRIQAALAEKELYGPDGRLPLHCSIGVACSTPDTTVDALIDRADAALYRAKQLGRDQVSVDCPS